MAGEFGVEGGLGRLSSPHLALEINTMGGMGGDRDGI